MTEKIQEIIQRVVAGKGDEADLQAIAAALQSGQLVLVTGDRSIAIDGNVSNSVMVAGDNNQVILLPEENALSLERILQRWQPKQGQYVQPKGCQKRQECDRYLEVALQRLERLGSPEILKDEVYKGRRFNYIARMVDFEPGLGMRGEAFFLFSEFAFINLKGLKPFSNESSQWARAQVNPAAAGQAFYNFRMPTHFCFAVALVDQVEETVAVEIQTTNSFGHRVDLLWYEIPVVYELSQQRLLYYNKASSFWENFRGEVVWQPLRTVIQQVLVP
ncbi:MAG: hypothetical protein KME45_19635 [Stenomitos rutilans HA7619-LM2]|jgi:hypothetical protein|nr:hypothetical protein [Stenomitos rutilans HA7619-LM2]